MRKSDRIGEERSGAERSDVAIYAEMSKPQQAYLMLQFFLLGLGWSSFNIGYGLACHCFRSPYSLKGPMETPPHSLLDGLVENVGKKRNGG